LVGALVSCAWCCMADGLLFRCCNGHHWGGGWGWWAARNVFSGLQRRARAEGHRPHCRPGQPARQSVSVGQPQHLHCILHLVLLVPVH
jgi:hypothetical protein